MSILLRHQEFRTNRKMRNANDAEWGARSRTCVLLNELNESNESYFVSNSSSSNGSDRHSDNK